MEETMTQFMQMSMANQKNQEAAIKNLETQVGQLAQEIAANKSSSSFSANTEANPKEHCKAVVTIKGPTRSKREIEEDEVNDEIKVVMENQRKEREEDEVEKEATKKKSEKVEKRNNGRRKSAKEKMANNVIPNQNLPYPHALSTKENARCYARFMDIFKQLHINIPFAEALEQMPKYAKFMKNILIKKKRYTNEETILRDARCSAVIQKTTPRKESDPGRVTLPLTIGGNYDGNDLIDLGSSINVIPLSIVKRLGNIVMKTTRMTLQLADKSITSPYGVAQDMLVKVDKFFFWWILW
ncbi:uncharacterized protein LOC131649601 [Vicia villosa]|uniref:uncharacterized protein LOC131649601 n=1 Tax=Vicia villosa TaxID=3911 RepID=UPI00273CEA8B|nr:uncharacterized protein LOC131649601 [Vicia villosa]